ncbi:hypothetical protein BDZ94DRAFT_1236163 [Collybia nuda]|uniref:Uncharacterized protein n=1 Tax=Collybia nuda TaxID=64659 RepID=A0A9P5Y868_9AGAR|nr:hypothetical protein BDZ94DRAFT_1236163 [Collybia nuda]
MPRLKKTKFLTNLQVPWGPTGQDNKRKECSDDKENGHMNQTHPLCEDQADGNTGSSLTAGSEQMGFDGLNYVPCLNLPSVPTVNPGPRESGQNESPVYEKTGIFVPAPSIESVTLALVDIKKILKPPRDKGPGYKPHGLDKFVHGRLEAMKKFMWKYVEGQQTSKWTAASLQTAQDHERGPNHAQTLQEWTLAFLADRKNIPTNVYGTWNTSKLDDKDLAHAILLHLQSLGPYIRAQDVVDFVKQPEIQEKFELKKPISRATAQQWMLHLGYRWTNTPGGQYVDGHEQIDVIEYWQKEDVPESRNPRPVVVWFHDESTFYANDRRKLRWVHKSEKAVPRPKGEGASLMVADFVSADYGWLRSPDGTKEARVLFKAGINREGYFTNDDILKHATTAMDILTEYYPDEEHILVFDNASTHLKRADSALSACDMPKGTKAVGEFWGAVVPVLDGDGKQVYKRDENGKLTRKPLKEKFTWMTPSLLMAVRNPCTSLMTIQHTLAVSRGSNANLEQQSVVSGVSCTHNQTSKWLTLSWKYTVVSEVSGFCSCQSSICWGYAKRKYREFPPSSAEADLQKNVLAALDMIPLVTMRRFSYHSQRFMHAYNEGLSGKDAAWACKKYKGHRVIPQNLLVGLEHTNAGTAAH